MEESSADATVGQKYPAIAITILYHCVAGSKPDVFPYLKLCVGAFPLLTTIKCWQGTLFEDLNLYALMPLSCWINVGSLV